MKSNQSAVAGGDSPRGGGVSLNPPGGAGGLGGSGLGAAGGQRLPVAPRERRPALAALAVLLILGGALTSAYLVMASGQRVSAIRIAQPVAAGQRIPASALQEVQVGDTGDDYFIAWSERAKVVQAYAAVPLVKGALLTNGMVSRDDDAARGRVVVGLAVKPGQFPGGVTVGARVALYAVAAGAGGGSGGGRTGTVLSGDAIVMDIGRGDAEKLGGGDQTTLDVAVPAAEAAKVAQAASLGAVAVALLPEGTKIPTTQGGGGDVPPAGKTQQPTGTAPNSGTSPSAGN
ncbi:hypothetical protein BTM25_16600 [Actinomadura rubteroloni]|uniref:SAF domain-containing protein n=2 Tax=Actinomadura rubteroloni TaxID=1926885 RepID=A0A2P4UQE7_9ACTN|nr:hypothetical protein BTM25_16600 [Actinomadura rubteroloni]